MIDLSQSREKRRYLVLPEELSPALTGTPWNSTTSPSCRSNRSSWSGSSWPDSATSGWVGGVAGGFGFAVAGTLLATGGPAGWLRCCCELSERLASPDTGLATSASTTSSMASAADPGNTDRSETAVSINASSGQFSLLLSSELSANSALLLPRFWNRKNKARHAASSITAA